MFQKKNTPRDQCIKTAIVTLFKTILNFERTSSEGQPKLREHSGKFLLKRVPNPVRKTKGAYREIAGSLHAFYDIIFETANSVEA